jgi:hypothetical protein
LKLSEVSRAIEHGRRAIRVARRKNRPAAVKGLSPAKIVAAAKEQEAAEETERNEDFGVSVGPGKDGMKYPQPDRGWDASEADRPDWTYLMKMMVRVLPDPATPEEWDDAALGSKHLSLLRSWFLQQRVDFSRPHTRLNPTFGEVIRQWGNSKKAKGGDVLPDSLPGKLATLICPPEKKKRKREAKEDKKEKKKEKEKKKKKKEDDDEREEEEEGKD